jgi:hypothetical protein
VPAARIPRGGRRSRRGSDAGNGTGVAFPYGSDSVDRPELERLALAAGRQAVVDQGEERAGCSVDVHLGPSALARSSSAFPSKGPAGKWSAPMGVITARRVPVVVRRRVVSSPARWTAGSHLVSSISGPHVTRPSCAISTTADGAIVWSVASATARVGRIDRGIRQPLRCHAAGPQLRRSCTIVGLGR